MGIMVKIFLMAYLIVMVFVSILSVLWALSLVFTPEWMKRKLPIKH